MAGLADIDSAAETVVVFGTPVPVYGVSGRGIAMLLARFPELRALMAGQADKVAPERLMEFGGEVVGAIIAAGTGAPGDANSEAIADRLPVDVQAELLAAIAKRTFKDGFGPFVERLAALGVVLNAEGQSPKAPATKSRSRSSS